MKVSVVSTGFSVSVSQQRECFASTKSSLAQGRYSVFLDLRVICRKVGPVTLPFGISKRIRLKKTDLFYKKICRDEEIEKDLSSAAHSPTVCNGQS